MNAENKLGYVVLASESGPVEVVRELLIRGNLNVNAKCRSALYMASCKGHGDVVLELLKDDQVDVNATGKCCYTVLVWALLVGRLDVVRELLQND